MTTIPAKAPAQLLQAEWVPFSGGELEGRRPRALCVDCRNKLNHEANSVRLLPQAVHPTPDIARSAIRAPHVARGASHPLCFQCYRTELERERALEAASELDTASDARFQFVLPLKPVNHARLVRLKIERQAARRAQAAASPYVDRRRRAQINARHSLQRLAEGLRAYRLKEERKMVTMRSTDVTLPDAWLPFVASR